MNHSVKTGSAIEPIRSVSVEKSLPRDKPSPTMAHFFLLLLASLTLQTFAEQPNLSRVDRLLDARYGLRSQRESNFDPRNYPQSMRLNEVDSNLVSGDLLKAKNRRHDEDDYVQSRRPLLIRGGGKSHEAVEGKKMMPFAHPIPVLVPVLVSQPYPVHMYPVNYSGMHGRRHQEEKVHGHEHEHVVLVRDYEHHAEGHGHEHEMGGHGHEHEFDGHGH